MMKKDILIKANASNGMVELPTARVGINGENLQGNIIIEFIDEFVDGTAILEIKRNNTKHYIVMNKENNKYTLPILSSLLTETCVINFQLRITVGTGENVPVWKSNIFYLKVEEAINSTTTIPEEYESWIDIANEKLNEIDNLDLDVNKEGTTSTVTITKKDGTTKTVEVLDGAKGDKGEKGDDYIITSADYNYIANMVKEDILIPTKVSDLDNDTGFITNIVNNLTNYYLKSQIYTKDEVNNIIGQVAGVRLEKVNVLPQTGQAGVIYLVPNTTQEERNIFDEYIWIDNVWELIGSTKIDLTGYATETWVNGQIADFLTESEITNLVNTALSNYYTKGQIDSLLSDKVDSSVLTDYIKNTDYATSSKGGVFKTSEYYGTNVNTNNGTLTANTKTYSVYSSAENAIFISKGTLENVITGKNLVNFTDYATDVKGGVIKAGGYYGLLMQNNGSLSGQVLSYADYNSKANQSFISKGTLENVITGKGFETTSNKVTSISSGSTDTQYPSAKCVYDLVGDVESILTRLTTGGGVA